MGWQKRDRDIEQRKSFRCGVADAQQDAELKVGRRLIPVRLFNESSGGFAAWAERDLGVTAEDVVQLFTNAGGFEVRVAHVARIEPEDAKGEPLFRVGLERLHELEFPSDRLRRRRRALGWLRLGALLPSSVSVVVILTILILAIVTGGVAVLRKPRPPESRGFVQRECQPRQPAHGRADSLAKGVQQVTLSKAQQERIRQIAEMTARAFQELDSRWKNDTPEQRARRQQLLLEATRREILSLLTEEQRERWQSVFE